MSQSFAIIVHGAGPDSGAGALALRFARAAHDSGQRLYRVFFYYGGVTIASDLAVTAQDETDMQAEWLALAADSGVELAVCVAAAQRRGIINADEQRRYDKPAASSHSGFAVVGLGQMIDAVINADHCVTFPAG